MFSGSVWLCPPLIYRNTLEVAKVQPRSGAVANSCPAEAMAEAGEGGNPGKPHRQNPAKPGLTSLASAERGESPSAPTAAGRCHVASLFAGQNLGPLAGEVGGRQVGLGFWVGFALPVSCLGAPGWLLR